MFFSILFLSACGGGGISSNPPAAVTAQTSTNGLNKEIVTLTNNNNIAITSFRSLNFDSSIKSYLSLDLSSTCTKAIFPLAPGGQCTYRFVLNQSATGTTGVPSDATTLQTPGVISGAITLPVTFANNTTVTITLHASIANYLYAASTSGVFRWNGTSWSVTGEGSPEQVTTLLAAANNDGTGGQVLYAGAHTGTSGHDVYKWDGTTWTALAGDNAPSNINALAFTTSNNISQLFTGSDNNTAGSDNVNYLSNSTWSNTGSNLSQVNSLLESSITNGTLYAGSMTGMPGVDVNVYNGSTWNALGTNGPSNVTAMAINSQNNFLYTASDGNTSPSGQDINIYTGSSWASLGNTQTPNAVHAMLLNNNKLYVGSDANFFWTPHTVNTASATKKWFALSSSASAQYLAAVNYNDYIYTSNDYGTTWTRETTSGQRNWSAITTSQSGQYLAADTLAGYIYTSNDYGANWTEQTTSGQRNWMSIASSTNGQYLAAVDDGPGYIYTSSDYGANWTTQQNAGQQYWAIITSSANGQYLAATFPEGYIYTSNDYGVTWAPQTQSPELPWISLACSANGQYVVGVPSDGYIYRSSDYGATWTELQSSGFHNWVDIASSANGQFLAATSYAGYIYISTDYGATWAPQTNAGDANWFGLAMSEDGTQFIPQPGRGPIYTAEGPLNAFVYSNGNWSALGNLNVNIDALIMDSAGILYAGSEDNTSGNSVFQYKNTTWTAVSGTGAPVGIMALALSTELIITN